ncbi:MAG: hypothetical protein U1B80_00355 [Anaerolineaceae bacterium]|nr:hypothetical protein [Anaerolineaceae bacterium]
MTINPDLAVVIVVVISGFSLFISVLTLYFTHIVGSKVEPLTSETAHLFYDGINNQFIVECKLSIVNEGRRLGFLSNVKIVLPKNFICNLNYEGQNQLIRVDPSEVKILDFSLVVPNNYEDLRWENPLVIKEIHFTRREIGRITVLFDLKRTFKSKFSIKVDFNPFISGLMSTTQDGGQSKTYSVKFPFETIKTAIDTFGEKINNTALEVYQLGTSTGDNNWSYYQDEQTYEYFEKRFDKFFNAYKSQIWKARIHLGTGVNISGKSNPNVTFNLDYSYIGGKTQITIKLPDTHAHSEVFNVFEGFLVTKFNLQSGN